MGRKLNRGRLFYFYRICTKINLSLVKAIFMKRSSLSFLLKFNFWIEFFWVLIIATSLRQCISVTGEYDFVENDHNDKKIQYRSRSSTRSPEVGPNPKVSNKLWKFCGFSNIFISSLDQSWAIISFSVVAKLFNLFSKTLTTTSNQNHDSWHFWPYQVSPLSKSSPPPPDHELGKCKKKLPSDPHFIKL